MRTNTILLKLLLLALFAAPSSAPAQSAQVGLAHPPMTLRAELQHSYAPIRNNASVPVPSLLELRIPSQIPVRRGNAGNGIAHFYFREPGRGPVRCDYVGGSAQAHPSTELERAKGRFYLFSQCADGTAVGAVKTVDFLKLAILSGDVLDPAGSTEVQLELGGGFGALVPPISAAESIAIRDPFSWNATTPLPETNLDGDPALYYTIIYIEDPEQIEFLDELFIHHDTLPLFEGELAAWEGQRGVFQHEGDGTGLFVFALIPGITYNLIREAALADEALFRVIALRDVPPGLAAPDGTVSYQALRDSGFLYLDLEELVPEDGGFAAAGLFSRLRRVVRAIASVVRTVVRTVQVVIGFVDRLIGGSVELTVNLDLRNTDPDFTAGSPMLRTWGSTAGAQITLPGVRVVARQSALGFLPTRFIKSTDENGSLSMMVRRDKNTSICLDAQTPYAEITRFLVSQTVCDFGTIDDSQLVDDFTFDLVLQHRIFNMLAQATEGGRYLSQIMGVTPRRAIILSGGLANLAANLSGEDGVAAAPCFGFPNVAYDSAVATATALLSFFRAGFLGPIAGTMYAVDIVVSEDPDDGGDANQDSRGLISHEYGHFALATLLYDNSPENITVAYTDAIFSRITETDNRSLPPADHEAAYINEAFADFFASQIAGGTNYVEEGVDAFDMSFCDAQDACGCIDRNNSIRTTFDDQVARVFSLLHDAFDGWPRPSNAPGGRDAWDLTGSAVPISFATAFGGDTADENIQLTGVNVQNVIHHWRLRQALLREDSFLGGLADAIYDAGYEWCDACLLFALHEGATDIADILPLCEDERIRAWIGERPAGIVCPFGCDDGDACTTDIVHWPADVTGQRTCGFECRHTEIPGCSATWTAFLNRDSPNGNGDFETLADFLANGQACPNPLAVECQTFDGVDFSATGEVYHCTTSLGGFCVNSEQPDGMCQDYHVRFLCP